MGDLLLKGLDFLLTNKLLLFFMAIAAALFGLFLELTSELSEGDALGALDRGILKHVVDLRVDHLNGVAVDITALGSFAVMTIFTLAGAMVLGFQGNRKGIYFLLIGSIGSALLSETFKRLLSRPRPTEVEKLVEVSSFSYPSGHSLAAAAVYLIVAFLVMSALSSVKAKVSILLFASTLIFLICFSRIYLGVHYPSDVLGGVLLGSAWAFFLNAIFYGKRHKTH